MPPRALFFDFDGVIADTENVHVAAWQRTLAELGWELADEVAARAVELDDRVFLAELFAEKRIEGGDVAGWVRRKQALTAALLASSPRLYRGVAELVRAVEGRLQLAVVTSTWRENVETVLQASGLSVAFPLIVAKEDVGAVKPDPECYLTALRRLDLQAAEAVALEDSPSGVTAARGAGIRVIAVGHRLPRGEWSRAVEYVDDLTRTSDLLRLLDLA